ncbi:MAG: hypothetical protein EXR99_06060 [Gemmataceae bacterium]|nr:hypothetical protein [Gemmataceae bacterium]
MNKHETGKQRATRIRLNYYRTWTPFDRCKAFLTLLALTMSLGWAAFVFARGDLGSYVFSRGTLADAHAAWNENCSVCHQNFTPIYKRGSGLAFLDKMFPALTASPDTRCQSCHTGPAHHDSQKEESTPACGNCHRDHRGLDINLLKVPNADCVSCHANLEANLKPGYSMRFAKNISSFNPGGNHPEFRIIEKKWQDPGSIQFNHKLHLTPGLVLEAGSPAWTFADIPEVDRAQFGHTPGLDLKTPVSLDCRSCHQLDPMDSRPSPGAYEKIPRGGIFVRSQGNLMLPVVYDRHCRACHPLNYDDGQKGVQAPHRLQPDELRSWLEGVYANQLVQANPEFAKPKRVPPVPLPGKTGQEPEYESARVQVAARVNLAMKTLFFGKKTCGECHFADGEDHPVRKGFTSIPKRIRTGLQAPAGKELKADESITAWFREAAGKLAGQAVFPSIPSTWFLHSRFDHSDHRFTDCKQCHDRAVGSVTKLDVLLPGIESCRVCHGPLKSTATGFSGGARHECVECHRYHHGDNQLQGRGAHDWTPKTLRNLQDLHKALP